MVRPGADACIDGMAKQQRCRGQVPSVRAVDIPCSTGVANALIVKADGAMRGPSKDRSGSPEGSLANVALLSQVSRRPASRTGPDRYPYADCGSES
jgi:hypothetical protein